jgi:signal transduction histidine kinase
LSVTTRLLNKADGTWMQIAIEDTGVGISPSNLEHIFDPFYTTKHESIEREGTGLGLTIVHQIIQEHHGYIEVESTVGAGTTFYINLRAYPSEIDVSKEAKDYEKTNTAHR